MEVATPHNRIYTLRNKIAHITQNPDVYRPQNVYDQLWLPWLWSPEYGWFNQDLSVKFCIQII